jgi:hypothetical protein
MNESILAGAAVLATMLLIAFIWWKQRAEVGRRRFFRNQTYHFASSEESVGV